MSTIVTSNVSDGTLSIPTTYVTNGSAKAWANLNGIGTIALLGSLNVSSTTDNGTGEYTFSLSSSMANSNFQKGADAFSPNARFCNPGAQTASSLKIFAFDSAAVAADFIVSMDIHGDLA